MMCQAQDQANQMQTNDDLRGFNYRNNQTAIVPVPADLKGASSDNGAFTWDVPKWSVTVLQFDLN